MNESYASYLSALRAFVQGTAPEKLTQQALEQVLELARINSTAGILCHTYMSHPGLLEPDLRERLRRPCFAEIGQHSNRAERMKVLAAHLDRSGIEYILFKGFVVRNYYPVPELRTFGDVDIIIHREDRAKSDELMLSLGYERIEDWEPSYAYTKGAENYELHSRVIGFNVSDKADFVDYFGKIWEHTCPAQVVALSHARELEPEFHFLYLLTHIAKHISRRGAGVRMYLDLAFFIKHFGASLDWDWVAGELEKLCLKDFANVALTAVEAWFGVESPIALTPVDEGVMEDFAEFTLSGGVYGYVGRDEGTLFLKQQDRNEAGVSRFRTLLHHAFPPVSVLVNKYFYLQKHPWLLPIAWIHRLIDKRSEWGRFADSTRQIMNADEEKVRKLKRIYKEIGL